MTQPCYSWNCPSPFGELLLISDGQALTGLYLPGHKAILPPERVEQFDTPLLQDACGQLCAYFSGERQTFDLPLRMAGTPFQQLVWQDLLNIPYGTTISYAALARRIGRSSACRAVGAANGANPISIIVPCHRVIGANGRLTGYGGGLDRKQWLLQHEASITPVGCRR